MEIILAIDKPNKIDEVKICFTLVSSFATCCTIPLSIPPADIPEIAAEIFLKLPIIAKPSGPKSKAITLDIPMPVIIFISVEILDKLVTLIRELIFMRLDLIYEIYTNKE